MAIKVVSFGGGVQSTALLVLAAQGKIDYHTFLFANVGEDSEKPATVEYVHQVAMPYARLHGLELIELERIKRDGNRETLYGRLTRPGTKAIGIPVRMSNGAPAMRACTNDFKIEVIEKWLKVHGAKEQGAIVALGISLDEFQRARNDSGGAWKKLAYPLLNLRIDRAQCMSNDAHAGLPVPPKSSCYFCPYHSLHAWQEMRQNEPGLFRKAAALEQSINERRGSLGLDKVWLTDRLKPLTKATTELTQESLFEDDMCETGYCMF